MMALRILAVFAAVVATQSCRAQNDSPQAKSDVHLRLVITRQGKGFLPPAVAWLQPMQPISSLSLDPKRTYTLLQKDRSFKPHLLVVPVGSEVLFPNADPFYHNVFSLFDGKRFDLGLYEAGSTKRVTFSREGVSYIFCNIHPEMSAVVIALSTPFYATADTKETFMIRDVPTGEYELHTWVEGVPQPILDRASRRVHVTANSGDIGTMNIAEVPARRDTHLNEYGQPYGQEPKPTY